MSSCERICCNFLSLNTEHFKALSHLTDLDRRSNTRAQICRFSGIGTSTAAQWYHIGKNGSTSAGHRQNIGEKIKNFCRCATGASNGTTTAVLRYGFVNVGRAPVAPLNGSAALRWPQLVYHTGTDVIP